MGDSIGTVLPMAVGVRTARRSHAAGSPVWRSSAQIVLVLADGNATDASGGPATWASVLKLVLGVGGQEWAVLAVFVSVASLTILDGLKDFMAVHNVAIMTVLLLVLGAKLIGDAVSGLSS